MADATIELGVKPVLDLQYTKKLMDSLEKELRSVRGGTHKALTQKLSTVMQQMVASGEATTATQARIALSDMLGGRFSPQSKGILRRAQNQAQIVINKEKSASFAAQQVRAREQRQSAGLSSAYDAMMMRYEVFKGTPSESNRDKLLNAVLSVNNHLSNMSKDSKAETKNIAKIEKDTRAIGKEASEFKFAKQSGLPNFLGTLFGSLKKFLGIGTLAAAMQKIISIGTNSIKSGVERGEKSWIETSMYGDLRDVGLDRTLANALQMEENVFADVQRKIITYRERLKWNQVSEGENIMWARLGLLPLVSSGEAAKNPRAFMNTLFSALRKTDRQQAMSALQSGGLDTRLMYAAQTLPSIPREKIQKMLKQYDDIVAQEQYGHIQTLETRSFWGRVGATASAGLARAIGNFMPSNKSVDLFGALSDKTQMATYKRYTPENQAIVEGRTPTWLERVESTPYIGPVLEEQAKKIEPLKNMVQYITNNVTQNITGSDSEDIAEKTVEKLNMLNLNSTVRTKTRAD